MKITIKCVHGEMSELPTNRMRDRVKRYITSVFKKLEPFAYEEGEYTIRVWHVRDTGDGQSIFANITVTCSFYNTLTERLTTVGNALFAQHMFFHHTIIRLKKIIESIPQTYVYTKKAGLTNPFTTPVGLLLDLTA